MIKSSFSILLIDVQLRFTLGASLVFNQIGKEKDSGHPAFLSFFFTVQVKNDTLDMNVLGQGLNNGFVLSIHLFVCCLIALSVVLEHGGAVQSRKQQLLWLWINRIWGLDLDLHRIAFDSILFCQFSSEFLNFFPTSTTPENPKILIRSFT